MNCQDCGSEINPRLPVSRHKCEPFYIAMQRVYNSTNNYQFGFTGWQSSAVVAQQQVGTTYTNYKDLISTWLNKK